MKVLFFTPHVALWVHTVPEAYLAKALGEMGHDVRYLSCGRALSYCVCMSAHHIAPVDDRGTKKAAICDDCVAGAQALHRAYRFPTHSLKDFLKEEDIRVSRQIARQAVDEKSLETIVDGVPVGRLALYEFTLAHKKMSTQLTQHQWDEYRIFLENGLVALKSFARYLEEHTPDVVISFSPQYSVNNMCMQYAISKGVRVLFIESGTNLGHRLGTMRVWDWEVHGLVNPALAHWGASKQNQVTSRTVHLVCDHFQQLLKGKSFAVYSSEYTGGRSLRHQFGVKEDQKVILMTLSSYDEAYAAYLINAFPENKAFSDVFENQAEWVKETVAWASSRPDVFLVIRVHPRDFPNKREAVPSEQSVYLQSVLSDVPGNVKVNWPSENISLYELLEDVDVVATGWSITAMESLVLGIPVVTYDARLPSYPGDIIYTGRSREEYFSNLDAAMRAGWSFANVRNGFRWLAYNFVQSTVTLSNSFGRHELAHPQLIDKVKNRIRLHWPNVGRRMDLWGWRDAEAGAQLVDEMIREKVHSIPQLRRGKAEETFSSDAEDAAVREGLQSLYTMLYGGRDKNRTTGLAGKIAQYMKGSS